MSDKLKDAISKREQRSRRAVAAERKPAATAKPAKAKAEKA